MRKYIIATVVLCFVILLVTVWSEKSGVYFHSESIDHIIEDYDIRGLSKYDLFLDESTWKARFYFEEEISKNSYRLLKDFMYSTFTRTEESGYPKYQFIRNPKYLEYDVSWELTDKYKFEVVTDDKVLYSYYYKDVPGDYKYDAEIYENLYDVIDIRKSNNHEIGRYIKDTINNNSSINNIIAEDTYALNNGLILRIYVDEHFDDDDIDRQCDILVEDLLSREAMQKKIGLQDNPDYPWYVFYMYYFEDKLLSSKLYDVEKREWIDMIEETHIVNNR